MMMNEERGLVKLFLRPISYKNKSVVLFWKQQTIYNSSTTTYYIRYTFFRQIATDLKSSCGLCFWASDPLIERF